MQSPVVRTTLLLGSLLCVVELARSQEPPLEDGSTVRPLSEKEPAPLISTLASTEKTTRSKSEPPHYLPRFAFRREGRWIQSGQRLLREGALLKVGREQFPMGGEPKAIEISDHLGGGFLFFQAVADGGSASTALYRATSWTSELEPLAQVPFAVVEAHAGFDRLYLIGTGLKIGLDLKTGRELPLAPLPPLVSLEAIRFEGAQRALVEAPLVGVLYSGNAGLSWQKLPEATRIEHSYIGDGLFVRTERGSRRVGPQGELTPTSAGHFPVSRRASKGSSSATTEEAVPAPFAASKEDLRRDERERILSQLLLQGTARGGKAYALLAGRLHVLELNAELTLSSWPAPSDAQAQCRGLAPSAAQNSPLLFTCLGANTEVFTLKTGSETPTISKIFSNPGPTGVLAAGPGAVLLEAPCFPTKAASSSPNATARQTCLVTAKTKSSVFLPTRSAPLSRQALAIDETQIWQLWLDSKASRIEAERVHLKGVSKKLKRSWSLKGDGAAEDFIDGGSLLPSASLIDDELSAWAVVANRFVGLRLGEGEQASFGAVQRPLKRALFDGPRAMLWGAAGFAKQSVDGGLHFEPASYPYRSGDAELSHVMEKAAAVQMGCGPIGCVLGRWLRFGWRSQKAQEPEEPARISIAPQGGQRYRFTCHQGGVPSPSKKPAGTAQFRNFWEQEAPRLAPGDEGFSVSFSQQYGQLYAWGPREVSWTRRGHAELRFFDPWAPEKIRRTAPSPRLFSSSLDAQESLGLLDRTTGSRAIVFDPDGDKGVFVLRTRQSSELFTFAEGKPLEHLGSVEGANLRNLRSAVFARGRWYGAFLQGRHMRIARLDAQAIQVIAEFELGEASAREPDLVRTRKGDLGISVKGDTGLLVYPLGLDGQLGEVILNRPESNRPRVCEKEARGFLVDVDLSLTPYLETPEEKAIKANAVRARLIVGHGPPCLEAMTATTRESMDVPGGQSKREAVPLSLLNVDSTGNRQLLLCE